MENNTEKRETAVVIENTEGYYDVSSLKEVFSRIPDAAKPLVDSAGPFISKLERILYSAPAFINLVKSSIPEEEFVAMLNPAQKAELAAGTLKLMTKKDGTLLASLVNPQNNRIVSQIPLKGVNVSPAFSLASASFANQMQLAQIAEQIQYVQMAVEEVLQGQENDRLAEAYSCQQKLLQIMTFHNPELKAQALLRLALDAEDSRNRLMLSQKESLDYINKLPTSTVKKLVSKTTTEKTDKHIDKLRKSIVVVNMVSFVETMAYRELGEEEAARASLDYYSKFIKDSYLRDKTFVARLDDLDESPKQYWSKTIPKISRTIELMPRTTEHLMMEE